ncbi:MAG: PTS transporter subunit EIIC [Erysipelotrichaceae bacterium]|uniref:PTS transporter subunit EIIC n=1 Tax=Floccifex sp. TaxID=2815810 RepID=UPI002A75292B|nr:PTS transporter subunit EIIC [Floccifex sp.]MDD7280704.1 PTS transporter subunit EIIC [Erysipelotrichaceae bacterium]MDY2959134.1 PTS transporter subunit EIIC [Floccifex sp.]
MKQKIMGALEKFSKAMVQPLMYVSVAGMIMVVGVLLTNSTITSFLPFLQWKPIQIVGQIIYDGVMIVINNLSVVFAVGIPACLAKRDKYQAALIGLLSYLIFLQTSNTLLTLTDQLATADAFVGLIGTGQAEILGIQCVDMSVFGGIIMGCLTGYVFNRTCQKTFKGALQIFSGVRFSFLVMFVVAVLFGCFGNVVWPCAQQGIAALANVIKNTGTFGLFLYGFLERLLIPTGLHHLVSTPFVFSPLGGTLQVGDQVVSGAYAIVMSELQMDIPRFSDSIYYMATGFTKMFGYIGIGLAFIHTAYPENKQKTRATIIPLILTACLGTITEPLDFMFIFAAPLLWVLHACFAGLFIALLKIFDVTAFCGGNLLASVLLNVSAGVSKTHWPTMFILGIVQIILYFVVFSFLIKKFNYHTPGREEVAAETESSTIPVQETKQVEVKENTNNSLDIASLVAGLGGKDNINELENCFTRLRVNVNDLSKVNEELINKVKNSGIVKKDNDIQIVYGLEVANMRNAIEDYMNNN